METIIYRKSDKLISGHVFPRRTNDQHQQAVEVEIGNLCRSELGGTPGDYVALEVAQATQPGFQTSINEAGSIEFTPIPPDPLRSRIAELLAVPRSEWTTAQLREIVQLVAQERI